MNDGETWREIRPGLEVSSLGRVRKYISGHIDGDGYLCVSGGRRGAKREKLHALVAEAFLGPRPSGCVVRHLDDVKTHNAVDNLAYGTRADNAADARRNGAVSWTEKPENKDRLREYARKGGLWWRGRRRDGQRGRAIV